MCFGGGSSGPSADTMYEEQKPEFGPLPSLAVKRKKDRKPVELEDVKRRGYQARSLLMPTNMGDY